MKESEYSGYTTSEVRQEMNEWIWYHLHHPFLAKEEEDCFMVKYDIL
jgi:hypothetical protein